MDDASLRVAYLVHHGRRVQRVGLESLHARGYYLHLLTNRTIDLPFLSKGTLVAWVHAFSQMAIPAHRLAQRCVLQFFTMVVVRRV